MSKTTYTEEEFKSAAESAADAIQSKYIPIEIREFMEHSNIENYFTALNMATLDLDGKDLKDAIQNAWDDYQAQNGSSAPVPKPTPKKQPTPKKPTPTPKPPKPNAAAAASTPTPSASSTEKWNVNDFKFEVMAPQFPVGRLNALVEVIVNNVDETLNEQYENKPNSDEPYMGGDPDHEDEEEEEERFQTEWNRVHDGIAAVSLSTRAR